MLVHILTIIEVTVLFSFVGASIYVSFFHHREKTIPKYQGKRKLSFSRDNFLN